MLDKYVLPVCLIIKSPLFPNLLSTESLWSVLPVIVPPARGKYGPPSPPPLMDVIFPLASDTNVPAVYVFNFKAPELLITNLAAAAASSYI